MKTQEQPQRELLDQAAEVERAIMKLDKAQLILDHWTQEYTFVDRPDPRAALEYGAAKFGEGNKKGRDSCKWFWEYSSIIGFIDIVFDYVLESRELLEKAICRKEKEEKAG